MYCRYSLTLSEGEARHYAGGWACLNGCPTPHLEDVQRVGPEEHGYKQEPNGPLLVARRAVQDVPGRGREDGEGEGLGRKAERGAHTQPSVYQHR